MQAEEDAKKAEADELERQRLLDLEKGFDRHAELERLGGRVFDFYPEDRNHYYLYTL
jgi:hypothetical protein